MALLEDEEKWSEHYFKAWQNAQQSVQRIGLLARISKWFGAIANR